jgi:hypothetical protein
VRVALRTDNFRAMRTLITAVLISVPAILGAQTQTPSIGGATLAEVAKKNLETRSNDGKGAKVYTNDDLTPVAAPATPSPAAGTAARAPAASPEPAAAGGDTPQDKAATAAKPAEGRDREYWNKRVAAEKSKLDQDRVLAEALQSRINALNTDFVNRDDPAQRSKVSADREKAIGELDRINKAIVADQKAIAATAEEARRSGVPAGWLR